MVLRHPAQLAAMLGVAQSPRRCRGSTHRRRTPQSPTRCGRAATFATRPRRGSCTTASAAGRNSPTGDAAHGRRDGLDPPVHFHAGFARDEVVARRQARGQPTGRLLLAASPDEPGARERRSIGGRLDRDRLVLEAVRARPRPASARRVGCCSCGRSSTTALSPRQAARPFVVFGYIAGASARRLIAHRRISGRSAQIAAIATSWPPRITRFTSMAGRQYALPSRMT